MGDRAQLALAGALTIGVILIGLALLLNTVIFTENLATRQGPDDSDGNVFRASAVDATAGAIERVNRRNNTTDDALSENLTSAVSEWSETTTRDRAPAGIDASVTVPESTEGTLLLQTNGSRNLTAGGTGGQTGDGNWTLADADGARQFRLNLSRDSLHQSSLLNDTLSLGELDTASDESFHVRVDDGSDVWRVYAFTDSDDVVRVFVEEPDGDYLGANDEACQQAADHVAIDLVAGTVAGQHCDALSFYPTTASHTIGYRNATLGDDDRAAGTYRILVEAPSVDQSPYYDQDSGNSPFTTPAIYAATIRVTYRGDQRTYTAEERVVP